MALNRVSAGGTLVGLDLPETGKNIELKPFAIERSTTDRVRTPQIVNSIRGDVGGDIKYAVTPNLTADLTVHTDFAQVEADEQQVNLTRFSLFFPEKRDFFLEGAASSISRAAAARAAAGRTVPATRRSCSIRDASGSTTVAWYRSTWAGA